MSFVVKNGAAWIDCGCGCRLRGLFFDKTQELVMACLCGSIWTVRRRDGQIIVSTREPEERSLRVVKP